MQKIVHTNIQRWKTLMKQKSRGDEKHFLLDIFLELASKHIFTIISNVVSLIAKVGSTRDDFVRLLWCWLQHAAFQRANSYFWLVDSENCCVCCDARRNTHRSSCNPCGCPLTLFPSLLFWFTGSICWCFEYYEWEKRTKFLLTVINGTAQTALKPCKKMK